MIKIRAQVGEGWSRTWPLENLPNFPDGSVNVCLPQGLAEDLDGNEVCLITSLKSSDDVMRLLLLVDALRGAKSTVRLSAEIRYCAYQQQDRRCREGEAFSVRVIASLINSCNFESVTLYDPHSDVLPALVNNSKVVSAAEILGNTLGLCEGVVLLAPDVGARKRTDLVADRFKLDVLQGFKHRNKETGEIERIDIPGLTREQVQEKVVWIIDDIALGGGTFIPHAKQLKEFGAKKVILYVSHGIFNRGIGHLYEAGIDAIWTTDSFCTLEPTPKLRIIHL